MRGVFTNLLQIGMPYKSFSRKFCGIEDQYILGSGKSSVPETCHSDLDSSWLTFPYFYVAEESLADVKRFNAFLTSDKSFSICGNCYFLEFALMIQGY